MKKISVLLLITLSISLLLTSCFFIVPTANVYDGPVDSGKPQEFSKDGITLTLTDEFIEKESERGFDAYYVAPYGAVMILKEEFALEEGLEDRTLDEYIKNVIENNGYDFDPISNHDLLYYYHDETMMGQDTRYYSFVYKGNDAFWIVQFSCFSKDLQEMEPQIMNWAKSVVV
ncbi:MAG: hypothetical protein E7456_02605 [Ruminococcaceae bacterium]|nr:hypothetical protein [Oscillospiraceae bacterium]